MYIRGHGIRAEYRNMPARNCLCTKDLPHKVCFFVLLLGYPMCTMMPERDSVSSECVRSIGIKPIAFFFIRYCCRADFKIILSAQFFRQMPEYELRHRGPANIAVAHKYNFCHLLFHFCEMFPVSNPQKITCIIFENLFAPYFLPHQSHSYGYAPSSGENLTVSYSR